MAAVLAISFLVFAVFGRVLVQLYLTGNHGIRVADATTQPVSAAAGTIFISSFAISLGVIGLDKTDYWSLPGWQAPLITFMATFVGFIGIVIIVVAQWQMRDSWRIGVDTTETTTLVTSGLYARSRNPIYFGIFLYWLALCVVMPNFVIWILALLCWVSIEVIVRKVEEPYLQATHGKSFTQYKHRTNRYAIW